MKKSKSIFDKINGIYNTLSKEDFDSVFSLKKTPDVMKFFDNAVLYSVSRGGVVTPDHLLFALIESHNSNDIVEGILEEKDIKSFVNDFTKIYPVFKHGAMSASNKSAPTFNEDALNIVNSSNFFAIKEGNAVITLSNFICPMLLVDGAIYSKYIKKGSYDKYIRNLIPWYTDEKSFLNKSSFEKDIKKVLPKKNDGIKNLLDILKSVNPQNISFTSNSDEIQKLLMAATNEKPKTDKNATVEQSCINMTQKAKEGVYPPIVGRLEELERLEEILLRKTKSNPILVGPAGAGKTSVVELLAQKIAKGDVIDELKGKTILSLDLTSMMAGTIYRGMFEERMKELLSYLKDKKNNVILFIDEIHIIMGAGSTGESKGMDMANMLKPYLSSGEISVIGATTEKEYNEYISGNHAISRRFQRISVEEPSNKDVVNILNQAIPHFAKYHNVKFSNSLAEKIVELGSTIKGRHFPDKAIDIIDEACVRAKLSNNRVVDEKIIDQIVDKINNINSKARGFGFSTH